MKILLVIAQLSLLGVGGPHPTGYTGPGNVVSGAVAWWGLRAYNQACANSNCQIINIFRASDSHQCDILASSKGGLGNTANCSTGGDNGETVATWCNATTCTVGQVYDQSGANSCSGGNPCHIFQVTAADEPPINFSGIGSLPQMTFNGTTQNLNGNNHTLTLAQPLTISSVSQFTGSSQGPIFDGMAAFTQVGSGIVAGDYFLYAGSVAEFTAAASTNFAVQGIFNNTSSAAYANGTLTSSLSPSTGGFGGEDLAIGSDGTHFWKGQIGEVGLWGSAFNSTQYSAMNGNQRSYWGF